MRALCITTILLLACNGGDTEPVQPDIDDASACGDEVTGVSVTVTGIAGNAARQPLGDIEIRFEDRWRQPPDVLGETLSSSDGTFELDVNEISYLEDCWASTDFVIVGEKDGMMGELSLSREVHGAITDGSFRVDLGRQGLILDTATD